MQPAGPYTPCLTRQRSFLDFLGISLQNSFTDRLNTGIFTEYVLYQIVNNSKSIDYFFPKKLILGAHINHNRLLILSENSNTFNITSPPILLITGEQSKVTSP